MKLPNSDLPLPDELLYSYFFRMLDINGIDAKLFETVNLGVKNYQATDVLFDIRREYWPLYEALSLNQNAASLYLSVSTFPFESIFLSPEEQTNYINSVFRESDKLNPFARYLFNQLRVCPQCIKEDAELYGKPYYHRVHQLSGVHMCPKHHVGLYVYGGKPINRNKFDLNDYIKDEYVFSEKDMVAYACYAEQLLNSNIHTDIGRIKDLIHEEFRERHYKPRSLAESFYVDLEQWDHKALFRVPEENFTDWLSVLRERDHESILGLLMFLFPDPAELNRKIRTAEEIIGTYHCDACGSTYYATPHAHDTGWGCPKCDAKLSYDERYRTIVKKLGNNEYEVMEPFVSNDIKIKHFHKVCGKEKSFRPRKFIFYGERCRCSTRIPESEVRDFVEENGFELRSYTNATEKMTVYHPDCDRSFQVTRAWFMKHPVCKMCEGRASDRPRGEKAVIQKIYDITADDYTFLSYDKQTRMLTLRHNDCGNEFDVGRSKFFTGQRCPQCTAIPPYSELDKVLSEASNGKYVLDGLSKDKRNAIVLNTTTNKRKTFARAHIAQELSRHTPSVCLPGIKTGFHFPNWVEYLQAYKDFLRTNKKQPAIREEYNGMALGAWCRNMQKLRKKGLLSEQRIKELTDAGFEWN